MCGKDFRVKGLGNCFRADAESELTKQDMKDINKLDQEQKQAKDDVSTYAEKAAVICICEDWDIVYTGQAISLEYSCYFYPITRQQNFSLVLKLISLSTAERLRRIFRANPNAAQGLIVQYLITIFTYSTLHQTTKF